MPLAVIIVEDDLADTALIVRELAKAGFDVTSERVETAGELRARLSQQRWDLCIADYSLPSFGAPEALDIVRAASPQLPFIVISGTIGEERAVAIMKAGADDYFLKGSLGRLGAAVESAMRRSAQLGRSESRLEAIMAGIREGVLAVGTDGRISFFNAGAERIFGHSSGQILGMQLSDLFPERLRDGQLRSLEAAAASGQLAPPTLLMGLRSDGTEFPIEAASSGTELGGEHVSTIVIRDITQQLCAAAELRDSESRSAALELQKGVLEEAAVAKSAFIASMNHELRTPLNAILGFSKLLLEQLDVSVKHQRYLEHIHDAGGHLLALITDVLDLARLDALKMELRIEPISLAALVEPAVASTRLAADEKGLTFTSDRPEGVMLAVDPLRVREILHNLLSNAIKFTPADGSVSLRASADAGALILEVADTGVGIPEVLHPRVFGAFERLHEGVVDSSGTGLGLALTKQLVELHGGTIAFESAAGKGSLFRVRLPDALAATRPTSAGPAMAVVA